MEKYTPVKELPAEITALPQEDTVCSYCGVSYLIHHEIKRLEQELKESLERSKLIETEKQAWVKQKQDLELSLRNKEDKVAILEEDLTSTKAKLHSLHNEYRRAQVQYNQVAVHVEEFKSQRNQVFQNTKLLLNKVCDIRNIFLELSTLFKVNISEIKKKIVQLFPQWSLLQQQIQQDIQLLRKELLDTQRRKEFEAKNHESLSRLWDSKRVELSDQVHLYKQSFEKVKETLTDTKLKSDSLLNENKALKQRSKSLSEALRSRLQELQCEQVKADGQKQLTVVSMESDRLTCEANKKIQDLKDTVDSLSISLNERENKTLKLEQKLGSCENELKICKHQSKKKLAQLEQQLEVMGNNHKSQLTELKSVCDQRVAVLEKKFIEREQELKSTCASVSAENKETIAKLKSSLAVAELKYKRMAESMQEELSREKSLCDQEMLRHLQEVKELEVHLNDLQKEKDEVVAKEVVKFEATQQSLFEFKTKCRELDRKLTLAYEEISKLQAVVQRQCEERQQLLQSVQN